MKQKKRSKATKQEVARQFGKLRARAMGAAIVGGSLMLGVSARAEGPDTTAVDELLQTGEAWVAKGVAVYLSLLGAGLAIVAGAWILQKIKSGIRSN